ncbi:hypothetical protein [Roseobacter sp. CCS2]|nr:hypothetical protein [Roseobacter sp. CCS2]EBA13950.1 hypothetical protein RCCS2_08674 [Roseobacter sp. CCS2]
MKAIFAGLAAAVVITIAAGYGLPQIGYASEDVHSNENVRLD